MSSRTTTSPSLPLLIVESPNKVKTISSILGPGFTVRASYGHIADIDESSDAVDIDAGFAVEYRLTDGGAKVVAGLREDLLTASELILATDDDREGEMIAHLLLHFLQPSVPVSRIVFHAITKVDVEAALHHRRALDPDLVEAARTRRVLDHLFGFQVSPVLWSKVRPGLGAGRVQNPALRLIVEREFARRDFVGTEFFGVKALLVGDTETTCTLSSVAGVAVATSKDIDDAGVVNPSSVLLDAARAGVVARHVADGSLTVTSVRTEKYTRRPRRPYITSDLLSDIVGRLRVGAGRAQQLMNQLHEMGLITYPRTDSPSLSEAATEAARAMATTLFGQHIVPATPNRYFAKKKSSQEAHEAIRPARMEERTPSRLSPQLREVYDMVWRRTVASQMIDATGTTVSVTLGTDVPDVGECVFAASGTVITEPGHRRLFVSPEDDQSTPLAIMKTGDVIAVSGSEVSAHATRPPARYTEASLIKALEEEEIGRPSTYASAIESLRREYVWSKRGDRALIPTITGIAVHQFMTERFPALVDLRFTRQLEERLDRVREGTDDYEGVLSAFFSTGDGEWAPLSSLIASTVDEYDPASHPVLDLGPHPDSGLPMVLKVGRQFARRAKGATRGSGAPYLKCGDRNVAVNDQTEWATITPRWAAAMINVPKDGRVLGEDAGNEVILKVGPFGAYVARAGLNASVPADVDLDAVTLDTASALLEARVQADARRAERAQATGQKAVTRKAPTKGRRKKG